MSNDDIDTASSATLALRIIVEAYAAAGLKTGEPATGGEIALLALDDIARHHSVVGSQKNAAFMARGLASTLIRERVMRFGQLPASTADQVPSCHVLTDPATHISVRASQRNDYGRPLLMLEAIGLVDV